MVKDKTQEDQEDNGAPIIKTMPNETQTEFKFEDQIARQNIAKLNDQMLSPVQTVATLKHHVSQQEQILKGQRNKHTNKTSE